MANSQRLSIVLTKGTYDRLIEICNSLETRPSTHAAYLITREVDKQWEARERNDADG